MAVKCPTTPVAPALQPGRGPQSCTSSYHFCTDTAAVGLPRPQDWYLDTSVTLK